MARQNRKPYVNGAARPVASAPVVAPAVDPVAAAPVAGSPVGDPAVPSVGDPAVPTAVDPTLVPAVDPFLDPAVDPALDPSVGAAGAVPISPSPYVSAAPGLSSVDGARPMSYVDAPVAVPPDPRWIVRTRTFARAGVWLIPAAAVAIAVASVWGVPRAGHPPTGASPGSWLVLTSFGLALGLIGLIALAVLLVPTPGRGWGLAGLIVAVFGTVLAAPVLGVAGLARPAVSHLGDPVAAAFDADLGGGPVLRWLGIGGLVLLGVAWILVALAVIGSMVFNRMDGYLILGAVGVGLISVFLPPLLALAALILVAAGLGIAWTATRSLVE
jgi:Amt family ammonium transporter